EFIRGRENWEFAGGYVDEGISGKSVEKRAQFLRMIRDARDGAFDLIITKEISRFSRSTLDSIKYTQDLLGCGVGVLFQSDNINTLLPDSELRLTIMASIAQEEVRKLSERLRFGYRRSIEKGRVLGQNNMFGYEKADGRLTVVEAEAAVVRRIFELYVRGDMGVRRIGRELEKEGIVSPNTGRMFGSDSIKYILQNPKYKGFYCSGKTVSIDYRQNKRIRMEDADWHVVRDGNIPAIVGEEIWDRANAMYRARGAKAKGNEGAYVQRYPFSGKLICGEHGASYHRHVYKSKSRGEQEVWNCKLYRQKGKVDGCDSPTIYTSELQQILGDIYKTIYDGRDRVINGLMEIYAGGGGEYDYASEIAAKEVEITKISKNKDALLDLLMEELITKQDFKRRNDLMTADIERIEGEIKAIERDVKLQSQNEGDLHKLRKILEEQFDEETHFNVELNSVLLDKIIVHKIDGDKRHIKLEIRLNLGSTYLVEREKKNIISLEQIGISQAQVSRLEKNALKNMRKYIS
ncbi:MAG: recombinase family protein, partial [Defluviitaleaceae bacterium]|nr:recombinase family protein [Defluviitaleaceae bacterium]